MHLVAVRPSPWQRGAADAHARPAPEPQHVGRRGRQALHNQDHCGVLSSSRAVHVPQLAAGMPTPHVPSRVLCSAHTGRPACSTPGACGMLQVGRGAHPLQPPARGVRRPRRGERVLRDAVAGAARRLRRRPRVHGTGPGVGCGDAAAARPLRARFAGVAGVAQRRARGALARAACEFTTPCLESMLARVMHLAGAATAAHGHH
jgi:hypothetical protein